MAATVLVKHYARNLPYLVLEVYVVDINTQSAKYVAEHISSLATNTNFRSGYNVADVGDEEDIKRVITSAWDMFGLPCRYIHNWWY